MTGYPQDWMERRQRVMRRDAYTCQECGKRSHEIPLDVDHITPLSEGGDNSLENLQTLCVVCHYRRKHESKTVPRHAFTRVISRLDPKQYDDVREVKKRVSDIFEYESNGLDNYWSRYSLDRFVEDCFGWSDRVYSPKRKFSDPDINKEEVERFYLMKGKRPDINELCERFDISEKDAKIVIRDA